MKKPEPPPRTDRLASALRENLRRRKAQARGRAPTACAQATDDAVSPGPTPEPEEPGKDG